GGLMLGHAPAAKDPGRRLVAALFALAVLDAPLAAAGSITGMGALILLAGVMIAPSLATAFALLSDVAPAGTATEAPPWLSTAFGGGIAAGPALGGGLVDGSGTSVALIVAAVAVALSAAAVAAGLATLRVQPAAAT